jgi:hypothetical protein
VEDNNSRYFFDLILNENEAIAHIDGNEIFRLAFNPQNFTDNFYKYSPIPKPPEGTKIRVRSILEQQNAGRSDEEMEAAVESASIEIMKVVHEAKAEHIAARISENLHRLLVAVIEDAVKAYALEGTIELNKQAGSSINISQYKDLILKQHWARIRDLAGIKQGGARERKGFVWSPEKKVAFYKEVESLPKHKGKSLWQFALDELIERGFEADTIARLKGRSYLKALPERLFDTAVKGWRKYLSDETWNEMKSDDKPRAFEFRHALHLLGYPDEFAYSTLETYYYEGKKLSDNLGLQSTAGNESHDSTKNWER